jgi:hypothetical protein
MSDAKLVLVVFLIISEFVAFVLCVFGNLVVCYVMVYKERLETSSSLHILSTSVADLLVGLIVIPTRVLWFLGPMPYSFEPCLILVVATVIVSGVSLTAVLALSVGRFWAICFPFSYRRKNSRQLNGFIILVSWILPSLSLIPMFFDEKVGSRFENKCIMMTVLTFHSMKIISITSLMYSVLMVLLHYCMYRKLSKQVSRKVSAEAPIIDGSCFNFI